MGKIWCNNETPPYSTTLLSFMILQCAVGGINIRLSLTSKGTVLSKNIHVC